MRARALLLAALLGCDGQSAPVGPGPGVPDAGAQSSPDVGAPAGEGRVTLTNATVPGGPPLLWVAFSDGEGPWQAIQPAGRFYNFSVKSGRYGLAFVCELPPTGVGGEVVHATAAELPSLSVDCGSPQQMTSHKLSGKLSGLPAGATVVLQGGQGRESFELQPIDPPATAYQTSLPAGIYDLGAISYLEGRPEQLVLRRDFIIGGDVALDLDFAKGLPLAEQPLTFMADGATAPGLAVWVNLVTRRARLAWGDQSGQRPTGYPVLPVTALASGDMLELDVSWTTGQPPAFSMRGLILGLAQPKAVEVAMPTAFSPALSVPANLRPSVTFTAYPGALYYQLAASQFSGRDSVQWLCIFSAAWLGGATSYQMPDFTGAPGYRPEFGLQPQVAVDLEADAVTSSRDLARTLNDDPDTRDGSRLTYARKGDHLTPR